MTAETTSETENPEQQLLFSNDPPPPPPFALWYRPRRGVPWEIVARTRSRGEAVGKIGVGKRKHGQWIVLPHGKKP